MGVDMNSPSLGVPVGRLYKNQEKTIFQKEKSWKLLRSNQKPFGLKGGRIVVPLLLSWRLMRRWMLGNLVRLSKRATIGLARTGSISHHGSGDFVLAFSTGIAFRITQKIQPL